MLHLDHVISADVHKQAIGLRTRPVEGHLLALEQFLSVVDVVLPWMKRCVRLPFLIEGLDDGTEQSVLGRPALQRKPDNQPSL